MNFNTDLLFLNKNSIPQSLDWGESSFFQIYNLAYKNPILDTLMVFGAEYLIFIVVFFVAVSFFLGKTQDKKAVILSFLGLLTAFLLVKLIRVFYLEPRPFVTFPITPLVNHEADAAFPSVHTTILATIAFAYTYYKSKLASLFWILAIWTGFARIFTGLHYPFDILGGILVSFLSILFIATVLKKLAKI